MMHFMNAIKYGVVFAVAFFSSVHPANTDMRAMERQLERLTNLIQGGFFNNGLAGEVASIRQQTDKIKHVDERVDTIKHSLKELHHFCKQASKDGNEVLKRELAAVADRISVVLSATESNQELLQKLVQRASTAEVVKQLTQLSQVLAQAGDQQSKEIGERIRHLVDHFVQKIEHDIDAELLAEKHKAEMEMLEDRRKIELQRAEDEVAVRQQNLDIERELAKVRSDEIAAKVSGVNDLVVLQKRMTVLEQKFQKKAHSVIAANLCLAGGIGVLAGLAELLALKLFAQNDIASNVDRYALERFFSACVTSVVSNGFLQVGLDGCDEKDVAAGAAWATFASSSVTVLAECCRVVNNDSLAPYVLRAAVASVVAALCANKLDDDRADAQNELAALQSQKGKIQKYLLELGANSTVKASI